MKRLAAALLLAFLPLPHPGGSGGGAAAFEANEWLYVLHYCYKAEVNDYTLGATSESDWLSRLMQSTADGDCFHRGGHPLGVKLVKEIRHGVGVFGPYVVWQIQTLSGATAYVPLVPEGDMI
jgi:hypothetical protein